MTDSLIDYSPGTNTPDTATENPASARAPAKGMHHYTLDGVTHEIPENFWDPETKSVRLGSLLKSHGDLRSRIGERRKPPETYEIRLPEDLQSAISANPDDPLAQSAMDWARRHELSQEAFDELAEAFFRNEAQSFDPDRYRETQMSALDEALGSDAEKVRKDIGQWFGALMGQDFEESPELLAAAEELAADARGVLLLKTLRDRLSEHGVPDRRSDAGAEAPVDEAAIRRVQASDAYRNSSHADHEATRSWVRNAWQTLVDRGH